MTVRRRLSSDELREALKRMTALDCAVVFRFGGLVYIEALHNIELGPSLWAMTALGAEGVACVEVFSREHGLALLHEARNIERALTEDGTAPLIAELCRGFGVQVEELDAQLERWGLLWRADPELDQVLPDLYLATFGRERVGGQTHDARGLPLHFTGEL